MVWVQIGTKTGRPKVGLEGVGQQLLPHPLFLAASQMKMQFVPASQGQNTLIYQIFVTTESISGGRTYSRLTARLPPGLVGHSFDK